MKILFCSQNPLNPRLGAPKVIIELAQVLNTLGCDCRLVSDEEISPGISKVPNLNRLDVFRKSLFEYLKANSHSYDVVDYDHAALPYPRSEFSPNNLLVARSVLLAQHHDRIVPKPFQTFKSRIGHLLKGPERMAKYRKESGLATETCRQADLVNVCNDDDKSELISRGINADKIVVIPFGLTDQRFAQFPAVSPVTDTQVNNPTIAFVGTFDARKGGGDFPAIVSSLVKLVPNAKFKLMGAHYRTPEEVRSYFPKRLHKHLEVIPKFEPEDLPKLLSECLVGVFPSYFEGFPFGLLEMLASGLPVVAYRSPGPPMMLPDKYLAQRGNADEVGRKLAEIILASAELNQARVWAQNRAKDFRWIYAAEETKRIYESHLHQLRNR